jgi:hypothetical protein
VPPDPDLHLLRKDSSQRLLDTWSQLAERYARPLDQDDIINLRTDTVVFSTAPTSISQSMLKTAHFGAFSLPPGTGTPDVDEEDEGDVEGTGEVEEELDELDLLNPDADISRRISKHKHEIPPVQIVNPFDASDLQEFIEKERRRREAFGDIDGDDAEAPYDKEDLRVAKEAAGLTSDEDEYGRDPPGPQGRKRSAPPPLPPRDMTPPLGDESSDELGDWAPSDATYVFDIDDLPVDSGATSPSPPLGEDWLPASSDDLLPPPSSSPDLPSSPLAGTSRLLTPSPGPVILPPSARRKSTRKARSPPREPVSTTSEREDSPELDVLPPRSSPVKVRPPPANSRPRVSSLVASKPRPASLKRTFQLQTPPRSNSSASLPRDSPPNTIKPNQRHDDTAQRPLNFETSSPSPINSHHHDRPLQTNPSRHSASSQGLVRLSYESNKDDNRNSSEDEAPTAPQERSVRAQHEMRRAVTLSDDVYQTQTPDIRELRRSHQREPVSEDDLSSVDVQRNSARRSTSARPKSVLKSVLSTHKRKRRRSDESECESLSEASPSAYLELSCDEEPHNPWSINGHNLLHPNISDGYHSG